MPLRRMCLFEALHPAPLARPFSKGLLEGDYLTRAFMPLRRIVPLRGTPSCAFGAALLQGPTRGGLSHIGFHAAATNCTSSRHSILRLWRGPSPRAFSRGIISHALLCRCSELCLFEALYPAPLARPFSKGLRAGDYLTRAFMPLQRIVPLRGTPSCAFGAALLQGPTRGGLFHMDFYTAAASCASSRHSILRLWRGPSPRAYSREEYSSP